MLELLREREAAGDPIRVALVGAGSMGLGIAWQIGRTPGMRLVMVADIDRAASVGAVEACGAPNGWASADPGDPAPPEDSVWVVRDPLPVLRDRPELAVDVVVEATNTIGFAGRVSEAAIDAGAHVVLMNAEVDLALGPWLSQRAAERGVVVTSDAGDQHGVLARMMEEIQLWGFQLVMAGNIKGYLDRHATAESLAREAAIRHLNPIQCCAYTDGTKLNIEMALVANGFGLVPWRTGMEGPRAADVRDVFQHFDFERYGDAGVVDYILGAEPGGGVFVVGRCEDPLQQRYLDYYKLGDGPEYLFYRPYHLCHLETTRAIGRAALHGRAILQPWHGRVADVYAFAKRDLEAGEQVRHGIGGERFYGMIERCDVADEHGWVPIALLEPDAEAGGQRQGAIAGEGADSGRNTDLVHASLLRDVPRDTPLVRDDIALPNSYLTRRVACAAVASEAAAADGGAAGSRSAVSVLGAQG